MAETWITAAEAARLLNCSPYSVYRMIHAGTLPATRRRGGRGWLLREADVRNCLEPYTPPERGRTQREGTLAHQRAAEELRRYGIG
jgi:excisionase family DNA binding protein